MRKNALIGFVLLLVLAAGCAVAQVPYDDYNPAAIPLPMSDADVPNWPAFPTDDELIATACAEPEKPIFMKESLRAIMTDDFRQQFPWVVGGSELF